MQTPQTYAGEMTEKVMAGITKAVGKMPTHNYNAIWSAVLMVMEAEFNNEPREDLEPPKFVYLSEGWNKDEGPHSKLGM